MNCLDWLDIQSGEAFLFVTISSHPDVYDRDEAREAAFLSDAKEEIARRGAKWEQISCDEVQSMWDDKLYDRILLRGVLQRQKDEAMREGKLLSLLRRHLRPYGSVLIIEENRMGAKVLAGRPQNRYRSRDRFRMDRRGPGFLPEELKRTVKQSGFAAVTAYYPYPDELDPRAVYAEGHTPWRGAGLSEEVQILAREELYPQLADVICLEAFPTASEAVVRPVEVVYETEKKPELALRRSRYISPEGQVLLLRERDRITPSPQEETHSLIDDINGSDKTPEMERPTHIRAIADGCRRLSEAYSGYSLQIAPCRLTEKNEAAFAPSGGKSLEKILDECLDSGDLDAAQVWLVRAMETVLSPAKLTILSAKERERRKFGANGAFKKRFGVLSDVDEALLSDEESLSCAQPELTFDRIAVNGTRWILEGNDPVPYFDLPGTYPLYAAVCDYFEKVRLRPQEYKRRFLTFLGISPEKEQIYVRMRENDRIFLYGSRVPEPEKEPEEEIFVERFPIRPGQKEIPFSPGSEPGILKIYNVMTDRDKSIAEDVETNAGRSEGNTYFFDRSDPQITIPVRRAKEWIELTYFYQPFPVCLRSEFEKLIRTAPAQKVESTTHKKRKWL